MSKSFHLAPAFYLEQFSPQGEVLQPAMWAASGDYVCIASQKQVPEAGFVAPIRVLALNNGAWDATRSDPELQSRFHISDKGFILASKLKGLTVWVPPETKKALEADSRVNVGGGTHNPRQCRLFIGAVDTRLFTKVKDTGVDPRLPNWVTQGTEYAGTEGHYAHTRTNRIDTLNAGWRPKEKKGGLKL